MTEQAVNPHDLRLLTRQRHLLGLLDLLGGYVRNTDFQKLLFLYCQEPDSQQPYEFVPYQYGAFSFTSYTDRRKLVSRELLVDNEDGWQLTDRGKHIAAKMQYQSIINFSHKYKSLRGNDLIARTYRMYPYYAIRSEIANQVLRNDSVVLKKIEDARSGRFATPLSTIGYEGRTIEGYLNTLLKANVTLLCDVRKNAISRRYGFSKTTLSGACAGVGIKYKHLPQLGIPSEQRKNLKTRADYKRLFQSYELEILPKQGHALATISTWLQQGENVALTCFEHRSHDCHRLCVARAVKDSSEKDFEVTHL